MAGRRYALWVAFLLMVSGRVLWPTLDAGFISDDFIEAAMLEGNFAAPRGAGDLFVFADGTEQDLRALQRYGSVPWWAHPELRLAFLRPLASAMIAFDHAAFGRNHRAFHAHSILWWALMVLSAAWLLRPLLPPVVALLSVALFALSPGHHYPVLWLANRGGLASLAFGLLSLHLYLRFRSGAASGWARGGALAGSLACSSLALGFGEWVFPVFAYFFAYECLAGTGSFRRRAGLLAVAALPPLAFIVVRGALGYGARHSGVYVDPVGEPLRFLEYAVIRLPLLWGDMFFNIPAHWWDVGNPWRDWLLATDLFAPTTWRALPPWRFWQWLLGAVAGLCAWLAHRALRKRLAAPELASVRWLFLGSALALVPVVASFPSSRLTLAAWVGAAPLVALVVTTLIGQLRRAGQLHMGLPGFMVRYLPVVAIAWVHGLSPALHDFGPTVRHFHSVVDWVRDAELDREQLPEQDLFILSSAEFTSTFFFPYVLHYEGWPMPRSCRPVSAARVPIRLSRPAQRELLLEPMAGSFMETDAELLFRPAEEAFRPGQRFVQGPMTVIVEEVLSGRPQVIRLIFEHSVDDPRNVFLTAEPLGIRRVELPELGEDLALVRPAFPSPGAVARGDYERRLGEFPDFLGHDPVPDFLLYGGEPPEATAQERP